VRSERLDTLPRVPALKADEKTEEKRSKKISKSQLGMLDSAMNLVDLRHQGPGRFGGWRLEISYAVFH